VAEWLWLCCGELHRKLCQDLVSYVKEIEGHNFSTSSSAVHCQFKGMPISIH